MFNIPGKTKEEIIKDQLLILDQIGVDAISRYKIQYESGFHQFWNNSNCSPEEMLAALGNKAIEIFQNAKLIYSHIQIFNPEYVPPVSPKRIVFGMSPVLNQDGTPVLNPDGTPKMQPNGTVTLEQLS